MLETLSPLPDWVSWGCSCFPLPSCKPRQLTLGFPHQPPPGLSPAGDLGEPGSSAVEGGTHHGRAARRHRVRAGGCVCRGQGAALIFFSLVLYPAFIPPFYLYPSLKTLRFPPNVEEDQAIDNSFGSPDNWFSPVSLFTYIETSLLDDSTPPFSVTKQHKGESHPPSLALPPAGSITSSPSLPALPPQPPPLPEIYPREPPPAPSGSLVWGDGFTPAPSSSAGEGGGEEHSPAAAASHPWEPVKGEEPHPLRSSLLRVLSRDGEAVQNIRKNHFHLSPDEPGSRRRCRRGAHALGAGFCPPPDAWGGDEEYYPVSPPTSPVQEGLAICLLRRDSLAGFLLASTPRGMRVPLHGITPQRWVWGAAMAQAHIGAAL